MNNNLHNITQTNKLYLDRQLTFKNYNITYVSKSMSVMITNFITSYYNLFYYFH